MTGEGLAAVIAGMVLAATTGLRRGELAGIVDDSLDLDYHRLVVQWQLVPEEQIDDPGVTTPVHKPMTKSSAGSRTIDLDTHTLHALPRWLDQRDTWARECRWPAFRHRDVDACRRGHPRGHGHYRFLFSWPDGRHLNPDWLSHEFTRMCRDADVPTIRLHDVRHIHASLMLAGGEQIKVVQERGGWASAGFVLDSYAHLVPGMQRQAAERFAADLFTQPDHPKEDPK